MRKLALVVWKGLKENIIKLKKQQKHIWKKKSFNGHGGYITSFKYNIKEESKECDNTY